MSFWFADTAPQPQVPPALGRRTSAPVADDFPRDVRVAAENYEAQRDLALYVDNTVGRANSIEEAYDRRIDAVYRATGVRLDNPTRLAVPPGRWIARARELGLPADAGPAAAQAALIGHAEDEFAHRLVELQEGMQGDPEARAAIRARMPILEDARRFARGVAERAAAAGAAETGRPYTRLLTGLAGGLAGSFRDPLNVGIAAATGPLGGVRTGGWLVLRNILGDAVINAAGEAALQPAILAWRRELGLDAGWQEAARNVGMAAVFGAGVRGAIELPGVIRSAGAARTPPAPAADLPATPAAAPAAAAPRPPQAAPGTIAAALAGDEDAMIRAARAAGDGLDPAALAAAEALEADRLLRGFAPEGISEADHARDFAQAVRFAEDPEAELPALPFEPVPVRRAPKLPDAAVGQSFTYLKKPVSFETLDAASLGTDAATFQYKGGGDAGGVTERLRSVTRWDNLASGKVVVFERADGTRVIADGHQRLGLARRLLAEGAESRIELNGYVFREADGWTPADVRAIAAKKNLQEGSGDVVDTARVLRERPTILDGTVATGSEHMRQARGLARLSDEAFGMVVNGQVAPNHAAVVGELMADRTMHPAALALLGEAEDLTTSRARYMVADMARAPSTREVQMTLLGTLERTVPLVAERARVLDAAIGALRKSKSAFRTVLANADQLESAGNVVAEQGSRGALDAADRTILAIEKLALRAGPISDALDRAAVALAGGAKMGAVRDAFAAEVAGLVERRGLVGLATDAPAARVAMDEPVGPEAQAQSDLLQADLFGDAAALPTGPTEAMPRAAIADIDELIAGQPHDTLDALYAVAPQHQDQLAKAGRDVGAETGAAWKNPGIKKRETSDAKMGRKGYDTAKEITDVIRGGFVVDTPDQAEAVVAGLAARFDILDEDWKTNDVGYVDRKVMVRFADGTAGEVQIWERRMYEAKDVGGKIYQQRRALPPGDARRIELAERETALYSAATRAAGEDWSAAIAAAGSGGSSPNLPAKSERIAASEGSTAVSNVISSGSHSVQEEPGLSTAQARSRSDVLIAGRRSQFRKNMDASSDPNVGASPVESNDPLAGVPRADDPDGVTATPARDQDLIDDVVHAEDTMLGVKQCGFEGDKDG